MVLFSKEARIIIYKGKVKILPGSNIVADDLVEQMKSDKWFSGFIKKGTMSFKKVEATQGISKKDSGKEKDDLEIILQMKNKDAVKFLKDCADIELLRKVSEESEKSAVIKAAEKQIAILEEDREKEKKKDDEGKGEG